MALDALTVPNLGPFELPTATLGVDSNNSGDGKFWTEHPGRPATICLYNNSGGPSTATFAVAPGAPGSPAVYTTPSITTNGMFLIPPGFLPHILFRRDEDQSTNPGTIYVTGADANLMVAVVRGPAGVRLVKGERDGPAITGSRTLVSSQRVEPLGVIAAGGLVTDTDGIAYYPGGDALALVRAAGAHTTTLTVNPNNRFGSATDLVVAAGAGHMMTIFPPGVPELELIKRRPATNNNVVYLGSDQAASTRYALVGMNSRRAA